MNQPLPGPRPTPRPSPGPMPGPTPGPTPGPRPTPGPIPAPVAPVAAVDPDAIRRDVAALLEQADNVAASADESTGGEALVQLAKQAHLLEQAHSVITDALEKVDRV